MAKTFECAPYLQVSGVGWKLVCRGHHGYGRGVFAYKLSKQELQDIETAPDREVAVRVKHDEIVLSPKAKYSGNPKFTEKT
jgi:hypothetical protein